MPHRYLIKRGNSVCQLSCRKCKGKTRSGAECKRNTCVYLPYCYQHCVSELGLKISQSQIPNAGKGLYVWLPDCDYGSKIYDKNDTIFCSVIEEPMKLSTAELNEIYGEDETASYAISKANTGAGSHVDFFCHRYLSCYANDAQGSNFKNNCWGAFGYPRKPNGTCYWTFSLIAKGPIFNGDELLWSYGRSYWPEGQWHKQGKNRARCDPQVCKQKRGRTIKSCNAMKKYKKRKCIR